jgi:hypothetical protein
VNVSVTAGGVDVSWTSGHPDGAPLRYALFFSSDGGVTREPVMPVITGTVFHWDTTFTPATANGRLIVVASDGFNTAEAMSPAFTIARRAPVASITSPVQHGKAGLITPPYPLVASQPIQLVGVGFDLNDGLLAGDALRWATDEDGPLGTGAQLAVTLAAGTHHLHLQAISSAGQIGVDDAVITVVASAPVPQPTPAPPAIGPNPGPLRFYDCRAGGAPAAQIVPLAPADLPYDPQQTVPWLSAERQSDGSLKISVTCSNLPAPSLAGEIIVVAQDHAALPIEVQVFGAPLRLYVPDAF